jgi:hypothetical protein
LISSNVPKNLVSVPGRLQERDEERQPDRHRHEQEVVDACRRELPAGKIVRHPRISLRLRPSGGGEIFFYIPNENRAL